MLQFAFESEFQRSLPSSFQKPATSLVKIPPSSKGRLFSGARTDRSVQPRWHRSSTLDRVQMFTMIHNGRFVDQDFSPLAWASFPALQQTQLSWSYLGYSLVVLKFGSNSTTCRSYAYTPLCSSHDLQPHTVLALLHGSTMPQVSNHFWAWEWQLWTLRLSH